LALHAIIVAVIAFLLGSIPFGFLLVRAFRGVDVRKSGSGNIGATNVARTGSKGLAVATLVLDALKGYVAVAHGFHAAAHVVAHMAGPPQLGFQFAALAAVFAILGHMFTPWLGFKGGKGVATGVGAFAAMAPRAVLISIALFLLLVAITRYVSLGSIVGTLAFPVVAYWLNPPMRSAGIISFVTASALLIVLRHKDNLRRLVAGSENRLW
jgi:acyl phosphate:glycerol-3-phosphate acyltransferase